ncbi:hypothetical protein PENSPDRAFT_730825 [Peniophora sp. CONT]|nr:hypothetical protein PENSPDRAFT_730825 [Peniophora sp. CONT]
MPSAPDSLATILDLRASRPDLPSCVPQCEWDDTVDTSFNCETRAGFELGRIQCVGESVVGLSMATLLRGGRDKAASRLIPATLTSFERNLILANLTLVMDPSARRLCAAYGSQPIDQVTRFFLRTHKWGGQRPLDQRAFSEYENDAIMALKDRFEALVGIVYIRMGFEAAHEWMSNTLGELLQLAPQRDMAVDQPSSSLKSLRKRTQRHLGKKPHSFRRKFLVPMHIDFGRTMPEIVRHLRISGQRRRHGRLAHTRLDTLPRCRAYPSLT